MYPSFVDNIEITSDEDDEGIDGILFLVDGELVTTTEEAIAILSRPKKNIEVEICFIQTKSSESFDRGEILKFGDGVYDFLSDEPTLPQGEFIKNAKKIFNYIIENVSKIKNGRPTVCLRYVCTSTNDIAVEIEATRKNIETKIRKTEYFSNVDFIISGLSDIMKLWDSTNNNSEAKLPVEKSVSYPVMEGIKEAYIAIVSIKEYINNILLNQDGRMRLNIYEENVRAFLGVENPVNKKIKDTILNLEKSDKFAVYNNGITIISPDVRYQNNQISLGNFQIVNGCLTSNVLYE